jgi:hypothetical protein
MHGLPLLPISGVRGSSVLRARVSSASPAQLPPRTALSAECAASSSRATRSGLPRGSLPCGLAGGIAAQVSCRSRPQLAYAWRGGCGAISSVTTRSRRSSRRDGRLCWRLLDRALWAQRVAPCGSRSWPWPTVGVPATFDWLLGCSSVATVSCETASSRARAESRCATLGRRSHGDEVL